MNYFLPLAVLGLFMTGCATNRHYYSVQEPIRVFEEEKLTSRRLKDIPQGAIVSLRTKTEASTMYLVPVEYNGFRLFAYAPKLQYRESRSSRSSTHKHLSDYPAHQEEETRNSNAIVYHSYPGGMVFISGPNNK